jgi:hypothetical protein
MWRTTADLYRDVVSLDHKIGLDQRLRSGWEEILQRAEGLAELARRADEAEKRAGAELAV